MKLQFIGAHKSAVTKSGNHTCTSGSLHVGCASSSLALVFGVVSTYIGIAIPNSTWYAMNNIT